MSDLRLVGRKNGLQRLYPAPDPRSRLSMVDSWRGTPADGRRSRYRERADPDVLQGEWIKMFEGTRNALMDSAAAYVIVGGGLAGLALGSALARDGNEVVVLEATQRYEDRVRGESMLPWGVVEADGLGVLSSLMDAGARITPTWVHYDAFVPTRVSLANPIPAGMMHPGAPGSLNLRHPESCGALAAVACGLGVRLERGVTDVVVHPGANPVSTRTFHG